MSHFVVLVIGPDIEGQLAPYQENNMNDCPKKYLKFNDHEDEIREKYETGSTEKIKMPDGTLVWSWDERFRVPGSFGTGHDTHKIPEDCQKVTVKFTELYPTLEAYAKDYEGYSKRDPDIGRYGYWENPNRKWDWYTIGGRWTGFFPLKANAKGKTGKPGLMTPVAKSGYVDQCLIKDIDIGRARDEAEAEARARFADWKKAFTVHGHGETFEETRDRICGVDSAYDASKLDEARKAFWHQPIVNGYAKILKEKDEHCWDDPIRQFGFDEEVYVQKMRNTALTTFAILKDGEWFENGEMGWWGVTHDEKMSDADWRAHFARLYDELPGDTMLTIVDCHI